MGHGCFFLGVAWFGLASIGVAQSPWSSGPLVLCLSILWSLVAVVGKFPRLLMIVFGASEERGPLQITIFVVFEMLRLLRSQETANTVFAALERLHML